MYYEEVSILRGRDSGWCGEMQALRWVFNRRRAEKNEDNIGHWMVLQHVDGYTLDTNPRAFCDAIYIEKSSIWCIQKDFMDDCYCHIYHFDGLVYGSIDYWLFLVYEAGRKFRSIIQKTGKTCLSFLIITGNKNYWTNIPASVTLLLVYRNLNWTGFLRGKYEKSHKLGNNYDLLMYYHGLYGCRT